MYHPLIVIPAFIMPLAVLTHSLEAHNTNMHSSHITPRASLLGESVSAIEISPEGRSEEWSVHAEVGSRPSSHLTHYTSSSLAVHTSQMGFAASVIGPRRPITPVVPNLPPSYQAQLAIRKGMAEDLRSVPVAGNVARVGKPPYPSPPPIPAPPTDPPPASLLWRTSSIAQSRFTALPSYRESSSPSPDTRTSHEYPPSALLPEYTESSSRSVIRNSSQATATDSTPDETMRQSQLPYTPPRQSDAVRMSVQSSSPRLSFQQHPFAMNAPVLLRTQSRVSSLQAFPMILQSPNLGVGDDSKYIHQEPVRERSRLTPRMCFMFGFRK